MVFTLMNDSKRQKYFQACLAVTVVLFLWSLFPAVSFSQNEDTTRAEGEDKASGITMQAVSGRVVETIDSGGYTYALVNNDGAMTWVALPKSRIAVGDEIACQPGMVMNNFSSPSLNKTFKQIVFSMGITSSSGAVDSSDGTPGEDAGPELPKIKEPENWKDF